MGRALESMKNSRIINIQSDEFWNEFVNNSMPAQRFAAIT